MALPAHVKVTVNFFSRDLQSYTCALYYLVGAGSISYTNVYQVCDEIKADWLTVIRNTITTDNYFRAIEVDYISGTASIHGESTDSASAGLADGDTCPEGDAVIIRRMTGKPGRSKRGRIFWPLVPTEFQSESALSTAAIAVYKLLAYKFKIPLVLTVSGVTLNPVTPDYKNGMFETVLQVAVVNDCMSRKDRRQPKHPLASPAAL